MAKQDKSRARRFLRALLIGVGVLVALFVVLGIIGAIIGPPPMAPTPAPAAAPAPAPAAAPPPAPTTTPSPTPPPPVTVTGVIDGDTFRIGPRTIRVLGIDACEAATDLGSAATNQARGLLLAGPVVLSVEPGVNRDRFGRDLRYVRLADGRDFGTTMVPAEHTGVFAGRNDASAPYVAALRAADPRGRVCDRPDPPPPPRQAPVDVPETDEPDVDLPDPDPDPPRRPSGGRVGRDGDGDGLCNESTVPVPC